MIDQIRRLTCREQNGRSIFGAIVLISVVAIFSIALLYGTNPKKAVAPTQTDMRVRRGTDIDVNGNLLDTGKSDYSPGYMNECMRACIDPYDPTTPDFRAHYPGCVQQCYPANTNSYDVPPPPLGQGGAIPGGVSPTDGSRYPM